MASLLVLMTDLMNKLFHYYCHQPEAILVKVPSRSRSILCIARKLAVLSLATDASREVDYDTRR